MCAGSIWSSPPVSLSLEAGEVHVWRLALEQPLGRFIGMLDPDELTRANRFHFEKDRRHFIVARGFLRALLGRYLTSEPKELKFVYGAYGKPALEQEGSLRFNMSHSHGMALYALTEGRDVGVDVEYMRADFTGDDIARRFFSPFEVQSLCGLPDQHRVESFFRCWTRKEAYIKATGRGLSQPLDGFDVTLAPGETAALLRTDDGSHERWSMANVEVGPGYAGAVAVEGPITTIRYWNADDTD
ncbi:MAG TPA: 4'-phosphopantetheinyl transferase superfamily protein [Pyrinomonadaceae bacterium]|nr:4'-phosphopantetheinyl transferase superfamily protein [Pyrinomonadaceae bacterium]